MDIDEFLQLDCYGITGERKQALLLEQLNRLTSHHRLNCPAYNRLLEAHGISCEPVSDIHDLYPLPVRLFKEYTLQSCAPEEMNLSAIARVVLITDRRIPCCRLTTGGL